MKYVLHTLKFGEDGSPVLFVVQYHYDCEVIVVDKISAHAMCMMTGRITPSLIKDDFVIDDLVYNRCLGLLQEAGIC